MNQHLLSDLDLSCIAQTLQRGECRYRDGRCCLKREIGRFHHHGIFTSTHIFGKSAQPPPKDFIPWLKLRDGAADRFHPPGDVNSESLVFWFEKPASDDAGQKRTSHSQVKCIDGCRLNLYQDFTVPGKRFLHLFELKNIRLSILWVDNRFHFGLLP